MKKIITFLLLLIGGYGFSQNIENTSEVKIRKAKRLAKKFLRKQHIPGMAISISENGNLIWSEGFGYSSFKPRTEVVPNKTVFRIASISKSITGVALAKMAEDNIIDLDKSIYYYLPDYPKKEYDFTVRQLAGNIAGIRHYKDNNEYALNEKMTINEGLSLFKNDSLLFKPGTKYHYTSLGFVLLSAIMQKASNSYFNDYVTDNIFKPLKMYKSSMEFTNMTVSNQTKFYKLSSLRRIRLANPVSNEYKVAGGGFLSTSEDIVKFGNELINPKILSEAAMAQVTTSQRLNNGYRTGYGMGLSIEKSINETPRLYHTGGGVGASSILLVYPEEGIVISVLTNLTGVSMKAFGTELEAIFLEQPGEQPAEQLVEQP